MNKKNLDLLSQKSVYKLIDSRFSTVMNASMNSNVSFLKDKDPLFSEEDLKQEAWASLVKSANKETVHLDSIWPAVSYAITVLKRRIFLYVRDNTIIKKRNAFVSSLDAPISSENGTTLLETISDFSSQELSTDCYDYLDVLRKQYYIKYNKSTNVVVISDILDIPDNYNIIILSLNTYLYNRYNYSYMELRKIYNSSIFRLSKKSYITINKAIDEFVTKLSEI